MSNFDLIYQAAKKRDAKRISLIDLEDNSSGYATKDLALTPAGLCAQEGDWDTASWLMSEFNCSIPTIVYGAVLGGHIKSFQQPSDSLPAFLGDILPRGAWMAELAMIKAFAQLGVTTVVIDYLQKKEMNVFVAKEAACGAAYGNHPELLNSLLEEFPDKKDKNELLLSILEGAAWAGNRELLLQFLAEYNQGKSISPQKIDQTAKQSIMLGCGSGGHLGLFTYLKSHFTNIHDSDVLITIKRAALYDHYDFITAVIRNDTRLIEMAEYALAQVCVDQLEKLISEKTNVRDLCIFINDLIVSTRTLFNYLVQFTKSDFIQKLCYELSRLKEIKEKELDIIKAEKDALTVIDLKNRYGLATKQALFLFEHPEMLQLIRSEKFEKDKLHILVKHETELNSWQFADMVKRVQKNQAKSQLIDDLEGYLETKTSWWYNHRERCASFLGAVKETKDYKVCRRLVGDQFRLFDSGKTTEGESAKNMPKYQTALSSNVVKDEYFFAIRRYHESFNHDETVNRKPFS